MVEIVARNDVIMWIVCLSINIGTGCSGHNVLSVHTEMCAYLAQ